MQEEIKTISNQIKEIAGEIKGATSGLRDIRMWLPDAIDDAFHSRRHAGTLDRVDIDQRIKEKEEDEKRSAEINALTVQINEIKKQTKEIKKQTRYLFLAFIFATLSLITDIILQLIKQVYE